MIDRKISRGKGVKKNYWVEDIALVKRGIVPEGRRTNRSYSFPEVQESRLVAEEVA